MEVKSRKKFSLHQRFERTIKKIPGEDFIFPVFMHTVERHLQGKTNRSRIDEIFSSSLRKYPDVTNEVLQKWVSNWHSIPDETKSKFVPKKLHNLPIDQKVDLSKLRDMLFNKVGSLTLENQSERFRPKWATFKNSLLTVGDLSKIAASLFVTVDHIYPTEPDGYPYVYLSQKFKITGHGFSSVNQENFILIYSLTDKQKPLITLHPTSSTATELNSIAPLDTELQPGEYEIAVAVKGKATSNKHGIYFGKQPDVAAQIFSVSPNSQFPGKDVLINGSGFNHNPYVFWKPLDPAQQEGVCYFTEVEWLSNQQLKMRIPESLVGWTGNYIIAIAGENQPLSNWIQISIKAFSYKVEFEKIKCIDESDPEYCGDDEIVARWIILNDTQGWQKQSNQYEDFEDGTEKFFTNEDKVVFVPTGGAGEVKSEIAIGTLLYEWDEGDVSSATSALDLAADVCDKISKGFPIVVVVSWTLKFISKIVSWLGGDPDPLGQNQLSWTAQDLFTMTKNSSLSFNSIIPFHNDDDTGSYDLSYKVTRIEQ